MAVKKSGDDKVNLRPIGEAIEEVRKQLGPFAKGNEDIENAIEALGGIHALLRIVCRKTYGIVPVPPPPPKY